MLRLVYCRLVSIMTSNKDDKREILKEKVQTLRMKIQELGEANESEETMEKAELILNKD